MIDDPNPNDSLTSEPIALALIGRTLLTPREAAASLAISPRKLWELTKRGQVKAIHLGRLVRYPPEALTDFVRQKLSDSKKGDA